MRIRTDKHEFILCPDGDYTLIVTHDPNYTEEDKLKAESAAAAAKAAAGDGKKKKKGPVDEDGAGGDE